MERISRWFLWLIVIGPLHMIEQMFTSIEEFYMLRDHLNGSYYSLFDPAYTDLASVILITIVVTVFSLMLWAALVGGRARIAVVTLFGLMGAGEIHHAIQSVLTASYDPGVITSVAYSAVGCLLLREVWRLARSRGADSLQIAET